MIKILAEIGKSLSSHLENMDDLYKFLGILGVFGTAYAITKNSSPNEGEKPNVSSTSYLEKDKDTDDDA